MRWRDEWRRLKGVDWGELDIKESGGWPFLLQLICCALVLGLTLAAMYWYLGSPKTEALAQARSEEVASIRDYRRKAAQAAHLEVMRREMAVLEGRMSDLREMLPTDTEIPSLIDNISEAAIDNQLAIEFIRLRSPVAQEFYFEQPFDLRVQGDYHRIAEFLATVARLPRIVTQHDLTLEPLDEAQGQRLQLSMLARTYSYRQAGEEVP